MPLTSGSRLGPYEVVSVLGAGGMGEVYRAHDGRLGRDVAIKVLPAGLASDPDRLKRFEREARSASSLNHPNIVTIYDIGSVDSVSFIAMELVVGESLRATMMGGALPVRQVLQIGAQIADGLAKAHASGIVHRDLKPENLMVTEDGHVKILDFGLAKLTQPEGSGAGATLAPTMSGATGDGVILGTVGYMSPEQAVGGPLDFRSDQFALGSILYEMATGRRAFQRASAPQTLAAIIQEEPEPIVNSNPRVPAPVRWTIERCLAKQARDRYASTEDLARDLATVRDRLSEATTGSGIVAEPPARKRRWKLGALAAGLLIAAASVSAWRLRARDYFWKNPLLGAQFTRLTDWEGSELDAAVSADGKFVAFVADRDGPFDVWLTQVGADEFLNLTKGQFGGLDNSEVRNVGFAPDGAHVWIRGTGDPFGVWLLPTMGGVARPFIREAAQVVWSPDRSRTLYHFTNPGDPIFLADANGAKPKQIFIEKTGLHNHYTTFSPDGRWVYFVRGTMKPADLDIWRIPTEGGAPERMTSFHARVAYPSFVDSRTLMFTAARPDGSGSGLYAMDVNHRISHPVSFGLEDYVSVSASGDGRRLVATVGNPTTHLWSAPISDRVVDDSGTSRFALPAVKASSPRFGPDYLLFLSSKGGADGLWRFKGGVDLELWRSGDGGVMAAPAVSPDGKQIAFVVRREKRADLYLMASDGTNPHSVTDSLDLRDAPSWSPDGKWIAFVAVEGSEQPLFKVAAAGGAPVRLVAGVNYDPVWSPDGRFIVYSDNPEGGGRYQLRAVTPEKVSVAMPDITVRFGGDRYRFLPGGSGLVVMQGKGGARRQNFWLLDLSTGKLRQLTDLKPVYETRSFDISPDGKTILFDRYRDNSDVVLIDLPPRS